MSFGRDMAGGVGAQLVGGLLLTVVAAFAMGVIVGILI